MFKPSVFFYLLIHVDVATVVFYLFISVRVLLYLDDESHRALGYVLHLQVGTYTCVLEFLLGIFNKASVMFCF